MVIYLPVFEAVISPKWRAGSPTVVTYFHRLSSPPGCCPQAGAEDVIGGCVNAISMTTADPWPGPEGVCRKWVENSFLARDCRIWEVVTKRPS